MNELIVPVREDDIHATYLVPLPAFTTVEAATHTIATAAAASITGKRGRKLSRKHAPAAGAVLGARPVVGAVG